jgi:hypothetical protein
MLTQTSSLRNLSARNKAYLEAGTALYRDSKTIIQQRDRYLAQALTPQGAIATLSRIKRHGRTPDQDDLTLPNWVQDAIRLMSDWRVASVSLTGGAQLGKSLISYLVAVDLFIEGRLSFGWVYPDDGLRQTDQPKFRKIAEAWLRQRGVKFNPDRNNLRRFELEGAIATFTHTNSNTKKDGAAHGSAAVSFSANVLFFEETSQGQGVDLSGRLQASKIPTKPIRYIGTPGSGLGIEKIAEAADYIAYTCLKCQKCDTYNPLHPYLLYLDSSKEGFFSASGKPRATLKQFECIHCKALLDDDRGAEAISVRVFDPYIVKAIGQGDRAAVAELYSRSIPEILDEGVVPESISLWLMPLMLGVKDSKKWCADTAKKLAASQNVKAAIQELLGISSDISKGLNIASVKKILERKTYHPSDIQGRWGNPKRYMGLDVGVDCHFLTSLLVDESDGTIWIELAKKVHEDEVAGIIEELKPKCFLIDNEPNKGFAVELSAKFPRIVRAANQSTSKKIGAAIKKDLSKSGGKPFECWEFSNQVWISTAIDILSSGNLGIIDEADQDGSIDPTWSSHIRSVTRSSAGVWVRPADHEDDLFFSFLFAVVAMKMKPGTIAPVLY